MFYHDPRSGTSSSLCLSSKSLPGVLKDMDVLDGAGDCVRVLILSIIGFLESSIKIKNIKRHGAGDCVRVLILSIIGFPESFIKIQHQKPHQVSTYPPSPFLESWRTWMVLMELEIYIHRKFSGKFIKVQDQEAHQDSTYHPYYMGDYFLIFDGG